MASEGGGSDQRAAFRTTTLVTGFEGKITCVTHYSSRVVIGSSDGRLVMYDTRKGTSTPGVSYTFDHGQIVEQIIAVPHIRMVVVVSNGELSAHGATDLQPLPFDFSRVNQHKVRVCCVNQRGPPHFRLGVAQLKRKAIMIYQYHNSDKSYKYLREFATQDVPEAMAWYRNKVVVGFRKEYFLLNDKSGESVPINSAPIQNPQVFPVVKLLPKEEVLISVMDRVGVFVGLNGEALPKNSITWSHSPQVVEFTAPYLVGMIPRVGVEIHSMQDQSLVQMIPLPRVTCMFANGMKWDMEPRPTGDAEDVVVVGVREGGGSNKSSVLKVEQMPLDQQVGELLDRGKIEEAQDIVRKSISGLPSDKQRSKIKRFQRQATVALLRRLEFESAVEYMYRAAVEPCEFIAFFPEYQCESFAYEPAILKPEVLPRGASMSPDIKSVINEILDSQRGSLSSSVTKSTANELVMSATKALMKFLEQYKKHVKEKSLSRSRSISRSRSVSSASMSMPKDSRRAEAIDTALFRLYVTFKKQKEMLTLIEESGEGADGTCALELPSCETLLMKNKMYYELGQLFLIQKKYEDAIDVYTRMHKGEYKQSNTPRNAIEAAIDVLVMVPEDESDFIYEQSIWIMKATSAKHALRIFTDRKPPMPSNDVVAHLRKNSSDPAIVQRYLETLVKSDRDNLAASSSSSTTNDDLLGVNNSYSNFLAGDDADDEEVVTENIATVEPHHTRLALEYIEETLQLVKEGEVPSKSHPGKEQGKLGEARKRLLKFLKSGSSRYDVTPLVEKIRGSSLYNEFVILCGRGGLHEDALRVLVYELNDLKGAESYSTKYGSRRITNGKKKKTDRNDALLMLVKFCFTTTEESKKTAYHDFAFQLLGRHGKSMDGKAILDIIPPTTPLNQLAEYFAQLLPHSAHNVRETRITKSLSNIYNLQVQCNRVERLSQSVEIDTNTLCLVCKKRIGDIVFAVYPNGKVVHYNCTNGKLDVCPVTGEKFS